MQEYVGGFFCTVLPLPKAKLHLHQDSLELRGIRKCIFNNTSKEMDILDIRDGLYASVIEINDPSLLTKPLDFHQEENLNY